MRTIVFAAAVAVLVLMIDASLSIRTMTQGALAGSSSFNPFIAAGTKHSPILHYDDFLFAPH